MKLIYRNPSGTRSRASASSRKRTFRRPVRKGKSGPSAAVRRKISLGVKRAMAAKSRNPVSVIRRVSRPATFRRRRGIGRTQSIGLRSLFSKDNLTMAGGAFAASFLTTVVLNRFSEARNPNAAFKLPFTSAAGGANVYGEAVYGLIIPVGGAILIRKKSPSAARGMIISGIFNLFNAVANFVSSPRPAAPAAPARTGEYLDYAPIPKAPALTIGNPPGYSAVNKNGLTSNSNGRVSGPFDSAPAFRNAW
jgi:hypothetical protein